MKNLVLLEGPDCSGKTTLAKALARKLGMVYMHGMNPSGMSEEALDRYHQSMLDDALVNMKLGRLIVMDRHGISRLIYQEDRSSIDILEGWVKRNRVKLITIMCITEACVELQNQQPTADHPRTEQEMRDLYNKYHAYYLAASCKSTDIMLYDMMQHGTTKNIAHFIREVKYRIREA